MAFSARNPKTDIRKVFRDVIFLSKAVVWIFTCFALGKNPPWGYLLSIPRPDGGTADAEDLKSSDRKIVRVRIPLQAPERKAVCVVSSSDVLRMYMV